jgi:hypothetical protein
MKLLALALLLAVPVMAETPAQVERAILATAWDLDGEGADADQVVTAAEIEDSKDDYTIAANPDTCRLVDITIVDANSSVTAGTITVVGTDCWGAPLEAEFDFAGGGSVVLTGTVSVGRASGAYFLTVTSVETGVITGEGGAADTLAVGYAGDGTPAQYPMYGREKSTFPGPIGTNPGRYVDLYDSYAVPLLVTTTDVASATLTSVNTDGPFTNVSANDLLLLQTEDSAYVWRKVTARASANSITLNASVNIASAGETFRYRKFFVFADPQDGWVNVSGWDSTTFILDVDANADTGGVISDVTCAVLGPTYEPAVQVDTITIATTAVGTDVTAIDLSLAAPYTHCRFGMEFGTNDDADAAAEDINIAIGQWR